MNKILVLTALTAILTACSSLLGVSYDLEEVQPRITLNDGYVASYVLGDCLKWKGKVIKSDKTSFEVIYVDTFGEGNYLLRQIHPKIKMPTYHPLEVKFVDKKFKKC